MKISGIYQIQSRAKPERIYIGSSVNIYTRWSKHRKDLERNKHDNIKLQNHYNKYGKEDLIFSVIVGCDKENLINTEQFYLDSIKHWFNLCPKAGSSLGLKQKKRNGSWSKGLKLSEEHKSKIALAQSGENNSFFGKHHSEASKQAKREWDLKHGVKPPGYHGGSKKGRVYKKKLAA